MTATARNAVREIVATMPITSSSAQAPNTPRRIMSLTWIAIASESGTASASATPSAIGCWAEASARSAPPPLGGARPRVLQEREQGAEVVEDVEPRARLDDRAERHDGAPTTIALRQRSASLRERTREATSTHRIGNVTGTWPPCWVPSARSVTKSSCHAR